MTTKRFLIILTVTGCSTRAAKRSLSFNGFPLTSSWGRSHLTELWPQTGPL